MFSTGAFLSPYPGAIWAFPHLNSSLAAVSRKNPSFRISDILDVQNPSLSFPMYKLTDPLPGGAGCRTQSALGPLQAFCTSKRVHSFVSDSPRSSEQRPPKQLKFGISAILSEEFGKKSDEKGECYNSVENKQLFYAIDKVYYILISFLTMNCKLTNLIFVFFVVLIFFPSFFRRQIAGSLSRGWFLWVWESEHSLLPPGRDVHVSGTPTHPPQPPLLFGLVLGPRLTAR